MTKKVLTLVDIGCAGLELLVGIILLPITIPWVLFLCVYYSFRDNKDIT